MIKLVWLGPVGMDHGGTNNNGFRLILAGRAKLGARAGGGCPMFLLHHRRWRNLSPRGILPHRVGRETRLLVSTSAKFTIFPGGVDAILSRAVHRLTDTRGRSMECTTRITFAPVVCIGV